MNMALSFSLAVIQAVMLYMASVTSPASATCLKVEDTTDKCRNSYLMINNKWYTKGSFDQIDLPYPQSDVYWYCGFSKERTGWGGIANRLSFFFSWDGTIFWGIYKCRRWTYRFGTRPSDRAQHQFVQRRQDWVGDKTMWLVTVVSLIQEYNIYSQKTFAC